MNANDQAGKNSKVRQPATPNIIELPPLRISRLDGRVMNPAARHKNGTLMTLMTAPQRKFLSDGLQRDRSFLTTQHGGSF